MILCLRTGGYQLNSSIRYDPLKRLLNYSNIADTVAALISGGLFSRFPNIRVCTIENGSDWVSGLIRRFSKAFKQAGYAFAEDPIKNFFKSYLGCPLL